MKSKTKTYDTVQIRKADWLQSGLLLSKQNKIPQIFLAIFWHWNTGNKRKLFFQQTTLV